MVFECKECGRSFGSEESLRQHEQAKHTSPAQASASSSPSSFSPARQKKSSSLWAYIIIILIVFGGGFAFLRLTGNSVKSSGAPIGVHWHADYEIVICRQTEPIYPHSPGGIHTHGDGRIHIHPQFNAEARENANLATFMRSIGGEFDAEHIKLPDGRVFRNGDACGASQGKVKLFVNKKIRDDFEKYTPRDGDFVRIVFE